MGDIWQAARANNIRRVKALLNAGVSPDATRWVRTRSYRYDKVYAFFSVRIVLVFSVADNIMYVRVPTPKGDLC